MGHNYVVEQETDHDDVDQRKRRQPVVTENTITLWAIALWAIALWAIAHNYKGHYTPQAISV